MAVRLGTAKWDYNESNLKSDDLNDTFEKSIRNSIQISSRRDSYLLGDGFEEICLPSRWTSLPNYPTALRGAASVFYKDGLYVFGGYNGSYLGYVYKYMIDLDKWVSMPSMGIGKAEMGIARNGNTAYLAGGFDGSTDLSDVRAYNLDTGNVTVMPDMPDERRGPFAYYYNNKLYVIGGKVGNTSIVYDFDTSTWSYISNAPGNITNGAGVGMDDKIYFAPGDTTSFYRYDISTDSWETLSSRPYTCRYMGMARIGNKIFLIAGFETGSSETNKISIYYIDEDEWETNTGEYPHSVLLPAVCSDGIATIYSVGGYNGSADISQSYFWRKITLYKHNLYEYYR